MRPMTTNEREMMVDIPTPSEPAAFRLAGPGWEYIEPEDRQ